GQRPRARHRHPVCTTRSTAARTGFRSCLPGRPDELVASVRAPTLILVGDRDVVRPEHAVALAERIPGARLLIVPAGHGDYLGELVAAPGERRLPELVVGLIEAFLDGPTCSGG